MIVGLEGKGGWGFNYEDERVLYIKKYPIDLASLKLHSTLSSLHSLCINLTLRALVHLSPIIAHRNGMVSRRLGRAVKRNGEGKVVEIQL